MVYLQDWLPLGLVVFGLALLAVAYFLRQKAENLRDTLTLLYQLNQKVNQDALDFFEQAWPILKRAGLAEIQADIFWFGEHQHKVFTTYKRPGNKQQIQLEVDDMSFNLVFIYPKFYAADSSWLTLIMTTFVQILEQDLEHKHAEILTSQKRLERYQLFVQHEIKNIAQFIQLLSEQVVSLQADADKLNLVNRLQNTLPIMSERAKNTLHKMQQPLHEFFVTDAVSLNAIISEVLAMFELKAQLKGEQSVFVARPVLIEVFKNIFGNYRDHKNDNPNLLIDITPLEADQGALVTIQSRFEERHLDIKAERMFEPFWTTSESGLGLGLFLTRELLNQVNGEISFSKLDDMMQFQIELRNLPSL